MSEPFVGEVRMYAGTFAPPGWAFCDGQLLAVTQNDALFSLIGTIYGGDGETTFGLPDLRGRVPIHAGEGPGLSPRRLGAKGGAENVSLTVNQLPPHDHGPVSANSGTGTSNSPTNKLPASSPSTQIWIEDVASTNLSSDALANTGGSRSHTNMMPFLCVNYIIAMFGIYPSA